MIERGNLIADAGLKSARASSSTRMKLCCRASCTNRWALPGDISEPVGLWPTDWIKNSFGLWLRRCCSSTCRSAIRQARYAEHVGALQLQLAKQRVIAGVFNQHRIAMGNKTSNDQVQRMVGAMGGDDLAGAGGDRITGQFLRQMLAQAGIAQAVAVAKQRVDLRA